MEPEKPSPLEALAPLFEAEQSFAACIERIRSDPETYNPEYTALPLSIIDSIWSEIMQAQAELIELINHTPPQDMPDL